MGVPWDAVDAVAKEGAARAAEIEGASRLPADLVEQLHAGGFLRMPLSAELGGWDATPAGQGGFATQGVLGRDSKVKIADLNDGTSNTLAIGEVSVYWNGVILASDGADWVRGIGFGNGMASCRNVQNAINTPYNGVYNDISFGSQHAGGAQFVMGDGSVRFVKQAVDLVVYKSTASRDGGEALVAE